MSRFGRLLCHHVLGEESLYRLVERCGDVFEVEVVEAPRLLAGTRLRFTARAIAAMTVVEEARRPDGAAATLAAAAGMRRVGAGRPRM